MSIPRMGIFIVCAVKDIAAGAPMTTRKHSGSRYKYLNSGHCEVGKFYSQINFFFCEQNDRLLRDKIFYLVVEFTLLLQGFFRLP